MVNYYYDKPSDTPSCNAFSSAGFLRDGVIARRGGGSMSIAAIPPFLRALLVTDGTVTKILAAYFWEPVEVQTLQQEFIAAERPIAWIHVEAGDQVLIRRAHLRGADSGQVYASAFSVIRIELIPEAFRNRLIDREIGIGVLIRDSGLESYREVLDVGVELGRAEIGQPLDGEESVFRTYRIIIDTKPVILITESFPMSLFM
jgi:chorismate-pyruvate lyase